MFLPRAYCSCMIFLICSKVLTRSLLDKKVSQEELKQAVAKRGCSYAARESAVLPCDNIHEEVQARV